MRVFHPGADTHGRRCGAAGARVWSLALLFATLLLVSQSGRAADLGEFLGKRITSVRIQIEGAPASNVDEMQSLVDVAAGQEFSPVRIHDSLVALYESGLISAARVEGAPVGADGVALTFTVRPQARIESVIFEGTTVFSSPELRARLSGLNTGDKLSVSEVSRGVGELGAFYSSRGYLQARVEPDIELDATGTRASVIYMVNPGQPAVVSSYHLRITGAQIDLSDLKHALVQGGPFTQQAVGDEANLIESAFLRENYLAVRVDSSVIPDIESNRVDVIISVETGPNVEVIVDGFDMSEERKRELLPFYRKAGIDEFTIEEGRSQILEYVQRKGYFFADVSPPGYPDLSQSVVELRYTVEPGRRYKLSDIDVEGLDAIPDARVRTQLKTREASLIPLFGLGRGFTSNEMLRQDANMILKELRDVGYRKAQVDVRRGVSIEGENLLITFDVRQGPRTYVEDVGIRGNTVLVADDLMERIEIAAGQPLDAGGVTRGAERVLAAYQDLGYAAADVVFELVELDGLNGQERVRLIYNVVEGNRVRVRRVSTQGNVLTDTGRLERDFYYMKPGDWLSLDKLQKTETALYETNAFNSVVITSEPVGSTRRGIEERDVSVILAEARRYLLIYGVGYQSTESDLEVPGLGFLGGARGLVQLTNTNLMGKLYTGSAQIRASRTELLGQISFQNPRPFGYEYPLLISTFARRLAEQSFRSDRYTALIQVERRLSPFMIAYMSYNFERISIFDLQGSEEDIERNQRPIRLSRIGPSFARDTRNNAFDPTSGTFTLGSFSFASNWLGGNEQFIKLAVEHSRYYPIKRFAGVVYSVSGRLGLATPFGGDDTLPISERFFAGGARDLRGFGFERAGPQQNGNPVGGNALFVLNNELRFPIYGMFGGTVFSDTGNVFRRVRDFRVSDLTQTLGVGLRVNTPIGPVRLDFGFLVINKPEGERSYRRHFSFGQTF